MEGFLEPLEPLVEVVRRTRDPATTCDTMISAAEAGDVEALVGCLGNNRFVVPALRYGGVLDKQGLLSNSARDQIIRTQTMLAARTVSADRWDRVMTVPPYLRKSLDREGVPETAEVLVRLVSEARRRIVIASPFLDKGFDRLVPTLVRFATGGGNFVLLTRDLIDQDSRNARVVRDLRRKCGDESGLEVVSWDEEGLGLHMKAAVMDSRLAYVGSANFTWGGMGQQAELGVLLEGPSVAGIERLLDLLAVELRDRKRLQAR